MENQELETQDIDPIDPVVLLDIFFEGKRHVIPPHIQRAWADFKREVERAEHGAAANFAEYLKVRDQLVLLEQMGQVG